MAAPALERTPILCFHRLNELAPRVVGTLVFNEHDHATYTSDVMSSNKQATQKRALSSVCMDAVTTISRALSSTALKKPLARAVARPAVEPNSAANSTAAVHTLAVPLLTSKPACGTNTRLYNVWILAGGLVAVASAVQCPAVYTNKK